MIVTPCDIARFGHALAGVWIEIFSNTSVLATDYCHALAGVWIEIREAL